MLARAAGWGVKARLSFRLAGVWAAAAAGESVATASASLICTGTRES